MSFRCERCNKAQPNHSAPIVVVVDWRNVEYPERKDGDKIIDRGGAGKEIVREIRVCEECVEK